MFLGLEAIKARACSFWATAESESLAVVVCLAKRLKELGWSSL